MMDGARAEPDAKLCTTPANAEARRNRFTRESGLAIYQTGILCEQSFQVHFATLSLSDLKSSTALSHLAANRSHSPR